MTTPPIPAAIAALLLFHAALWPPPSAHALGATSATIAVVYGSATAVCAVAAQQPVQQVQCWRDGRLLPPILPTISFDAVAGGRDVLCGVRSGGFSLLCWNTTFSPKRIYGNALAPLTDIAVGDTQICGLRNVSTSDNAVCWRGNNTFPSSQIPNGNSQFHVISSGFGFSCGIRQNTNRVVCWGDSTIARSIQFAFANYSMKSIQVGEKFACGINATGYVVCKGTNHNKQLSIPANNAYEYRGLVLGANHSCAIRRLNRTVICWGGNNGDFSSNLITSGISFESISAGPNFTCGLITTNFTVICWGPGWPNRYPNFLPLPKSLPGPCIDAGCECNLYPQSQVLCSGNGHICRPCDILVLGPPISPTPQVDIISQPPGNSPSRELKNGLLIFAVVGSAGGFIGICAVAYLLWTGGICFGKKKIHNSVQPTITSPNAVQHQPGSGPPSRSSTLRRQGSLLMRRQRSGTSSANRADEFSFSDLARATNDFSPNNKIGSGSFGVVYRGKLSDGREVAIKRSENGLKAKKFQEKESAFESELAFLSRVHHKHLVRLVGFCEENEERLLVYEYMKNGALHDHLHGKDNVEKTSSILNSWKMRIKIALGGARGVEYLHSYAVPPIIHRDIKSSNILLDENWDARVSDFGLSLMGPAWGERDSYRPEKAAGTVGYIDPEYYGLNVLTAKSDVFGLGVVLLELLTGKRAIFKMGRDGPISVVDYAVPLLVAGELGQVLDPRVGPPGAEEAEAVELVAYTAVHCVHLEGKDRPTMTDVVANLERALALCGGSHGSISSGQISVESN